MSTRDIRLGISGLFLIGGILLIGAVDWRLAVGTFLVMWAHKLECH